MTTKPETAAIGMFRDPNQAQQAVRALKEAGFRDDEIGVLAPHTPDEAKSTAAHTETGAATGAAAGAGAGALWALGIAAGLLPGIGPVVAGGLLVSVLASAAGAAAVGGVIGALVGLGVPQEDAEYYAGEFTSGRTLVSVQSVGRTAEAWAILQRFAGYNRRTASSVP